MVTEALAVRAARIRLVVSDVDGVLTDATVYYSERGEELVRFSRRDGMGFELLRRAGLPSALLSREDSPIVRARAAKLGLEHVFLGVKDKLAFLERVESVTGAKREEIAFIGDDVNDVPLMRVVAIAGAPSDAVAAARAAAHVVVAARGGEGAFRAFADELLSWRAPTIARDDE